MLKIDNSQVRILLVDDVPVNLEIAGKALEKENYDIYIADSGHAAVELTEHIDFDLILLDIMMPEMDGFETYQHIRKTKNCKYTPIIFLTAKVDVENVVKGFELGAVDYIRKPFHITELRARVKNHIELKRIREELESKNKSLQEAYCQMKIIASTDPLTKLFNRREIMNRIEYEQVRYHRNARPFSIVIGDIDNFKKINDEYGHSFGDYVLITIAELMKNSARKQDGFSRWGGEEFLLLLPETNADGAYIYAEKLRHIIEETTIKKDDISMKITMTFGLSSYEEVQDIDLMINKADSALYEGKNNGKNMVVRG